MRFFKRGPKQEEIPVPGWPGAVQEPQPVEVDPDDDLLDDPTHDIELNPSSVAEAKLSIKELRLRKKELQAKKRELAAELAEVRTAWRERQAGRYSTTGLGRGGGGKFVRMMVQGKRRDERMGYTEIVSQIADRKAEIDDLISDVDQAILSLERYVLRAT